MTSRLEVDESELRARLADENVDPEELAQYFTVDPANPFSAELVLREDIAIIPDDPTADATQRMSAGATILALANAVTRRRRLQAYRKTIAAYPDRVRVIAEGDSWFQHPLVEDTLDHISNHVAVYCISAAGDELRNMFRSNEYLPALEHQNANFLLLSGGGNDLLGDRFQFYVHPHRDGASVTDLITAECEKKMSDMMNIYDVLLTRLAVDAPSVTALVHGYDYVIPQAGKKGRWAGRVLREKGVEDETMQRSIVVEIIDRFNDELARLAKRHDNLIHVDARKSVGESQWYDEIHPDSSGFQQVALKFLRHMT